MSNPFVKLASGIYFHYGLQFRGGSCNQPKLTVLFGGLLVKCARCTLRVLRQIPKRRKQDTF